MYPFLHHCRTDSFLPSLPSFQVTFFSPPPPASSQMIALSFSLALVPPHAFFIVCPTGFAFQTASVVFCRLCCPLCRTIFSEPSSSRMAVTPSLFFSLEPFRGAAVFCYDGRLCLRRTLPSVYSSQPFLPSFFSSSPATPNRAPQTLSLVFPKPSIQFSTSDSFRTV